VLHKAVGAIRTPISHHFVAHPDKDDDEGKEDNPLNHLTHPR
jgi:hypothetical protein